MAMAHRCQNKQEKIAQEKKGFFYLWEVLKKVY